MEDDDLIDTRPEIEPTFFMYEPLPPHDWDWQKSPHPSLGMSDRMRANGANFFRLTIVSDEYPNPPYPDGIYLEGWKAPEGPWKQSPFNFPLTAAAP